MPNAQCPMLDVQCALQHGLQRAFVILPAADVVNCEFGIGHWALGIGHWALSIGHCELGIDIVASWKEQSMIWRLVVLTGLVVGVTGSAASMRADTPNGQAPVTFNKDVLPILQKNCQSCHRPGEIGPMSFLTYKDTRPWARAMKAAVTARKMPPWFAHEGDGPFANDKRLDARDVATISAWADTGAAEGDEK